jgi:hypothetical protein
LKKQSADVKQPSFAQLSPLSKLKDFDIIPDEAKRSIDSFLSQPGMDYQAPEANAYEFQSSGIVDMLKDLQTKFIAERTTLEKEETESRQYYEMLMSDLDSEIKNAQAGVDKDSDDKAKALKAKASSEGELSDTITVLIADGDGVRKFSFGACFRFQCLSLVITVFINSCLCVLDFRIEI